MKIKIKKIIYNIKRIFYFYIYSLKMDSPTEHKDFILMNRYFTCNKEGIIYYDEKISHKPSGWFAIYYKPPS